MKIECRACPVVCEWVVHPIHCLRTSCPYVYAFEDEGTMFFGCVEGVFVAELDLAPHLAAPRRDVYGAFKAARRPLPNCHPQVERAYNFLYCRRDCLNPMFARRPSDYSPEAVRRLVQGPEAAAPAEPAD